MTVQRALAAMRDIEEDELKRLASPSAGLLFMSINHLHSHLVFRFYVKKVNR